MQSNHLLKTQKSFSDIYSIYYVRMLRFSQTYVIAEEDAENIVQDTFLYLWEHLELLEDIDHLDAFLFTLIKNRCLNFLKHQSYYPGQNLFAQSRRRTGVSIEPICFGTI